MADNAWKEGSGGYQIKMVRGARKDYSVDWTDWLGDNALTSAELTLDENIAQAGQLEISGKVVKFTLIAAPNAGAWWCSLKITSNSGNGLVEILPFRVMVI
jgi:hypothetical protein